MLSRILLPSILLFALVNGQQSSESEDADSLTSQRCPANSTFRDCSSVCEPKCGDPKEERPCITVCGPPKCQCNPGFQRDINGRCVRPVDCSNDQENPTKCPTNSTFTNCSSMCEPKCGDQEIEMMCIAMCGKPKCQCDNGFKRDVDGSCVRSEDCSINQENPTKCPVNSTFTNCSSMCEPKCGEEPSEICIEMCGPPKCQCDNGFRRDVSGACVRPADCGTNQGNCTDNEQWNGCGNLCELKCGDREPKICPLICMTKGACVCEQGFYRDTNSGKCVPKDECPNNNQTCGRNERWNDCGRVCEPQCGQTEPMMCPAICMTEGACVCEKGFFRDPNSGNCLTERQCRRQNQTSPSQRCTAKCSEGQKCVLQPVQCIRPPCRPIPTCVNDTTTAPCPLRCRPGQKCVLKEVVCVRAPCNPVPTCVDDDGESTGCAAVSCMVGQECVVDKDGNGICQENGNQGNCSTNEFWNPCTGCEATCEDDGPVMCTKECRRPGACRCQNGFFRNENTGQCVTKNECDIEIHPPTLSCANVLCMMNTTCIETRNGPRCVPMNQTECGRNERWNDCGGACEPQCGQTEPMACPAICMTEGACVCEQGFFRDTNSGNCLTERQCQNQSQPTRPPLTCANVRCAGPCIETPTGPQCQPIDSDQSCNITCPDAFECVLAQAPFCSSNGNCRKTPTCIPANSVSCKMVKCTRDTECVMVQVQCFAPPCYPLPQCVPIQGTVQPLEDPCALIRCREGYACISETVNCFAPPCPQQGTQGRCVPTPTH